MSEGAGMALPSQGGRVGARGMGGGRRRKGGPGLVPVVLVLMVVGGSIGGYLLLRGDSSADEVEGANGLGEQIAAADPGVVEPEVERSEPKAPSRPGVHVRDDLRETVRGDSGRQEVTQRNPEPEPRTEPPTESRTEARTERVPDPEPTVSPGWVGAALANASAAVRENDLVGARRLLSAVIRDGRASEADRERAREDAALINEQLVFSPLIVEGDPIAFEYRIQSGDTLSRVAANQGLGVDWRLIQRINGIAKPSRIRLGQRLKLLRGPFHAVVSKSEYRLDIFQGPPEEPGEWLYIRSFGVGLGEYDGTPVGRFVVREDSKLINPRWVNPRTGEVYEADHPENPIGEHWMGLRGLGESADALGYGIHGTVEPDSIGEDASMGCVRMLPLDVEMVYELLEEGVSVVEIRE